MIPTVHKIVIHINLHNKNHPTRYYILLHKNTILLYMENLHKSKNPTIYSIVSANYYRINLSN